MKISIKPFFSFDPCCHRRGGEEREGGRESGSGRAQRAGRPPWKVNDGPLSKRPCQRVEVVCYAKFRYQL